MSELVLGHVPPEPGLMGQLFHKFSPFPVRLDQKQISTHKHLSGTTGTGKTSMLAMLIYQLVRQGYGVSVIDPNGGLADRLLKMFIAGGYFKTPGAFDSLWYVEFTDKEDGRFLPWNWLAQPGSHYSMAENVVEACHRVWPGLAEGVAAAFDSSVKYAVKLILSNGLTLAHLPRVLLYPEERARLLKNETDPDIKVFFDWLSSLSKTELSSQIASAFRRSELISFNPALKYTLGQKENALDFRGIMDSGRVMIYNLKDVESDDSQAMIGALLTIGYERAARNRPSGGQREHHLVIDEAHRFVATSTKGFTNMLEQCRQYGLFLTMAHQHMAQLGEKMTASLANIGVQMVLRAERVDAEVLSKGLGSIDPTQVKSTSERGYTSYYTVQEQWESWLQAIVELPDRHMFVKIASKKPVLAMTPEIPRGMMEVKDSDVRKVKEIYSKRLLKPMEEIELPHQSMVSEPTIKRAEKV